MSSHTQALQSRLLRTFVGIFFGALVIFSLLATFAVDRTNRALFDGDLRADASSAALDVDYYNGEISVDRADALQIRILLGQESNVMIVDRGGKMLFATARAAAPLGKVDRHVPRFVDLRQDGEELRAFILPILRDRRFDGTLMIWRSNAWIQRLDFEICGVFLAISFIMTLLAWLAGGTITRRALDDAFARQRRFTADASHELRAPLSVIRAEADLALRRSRDPETYRQAIQTIALEVDRIEQFVEDLLVAARADSEYLPQNLLDISRLVTKLCARIEPAVVAKGAVMSVRTGSNLHVVANANALEKAVMAVLHNAMKYVPEGGTIQITVRPNGSQVEIIVSDTGTGFSQAALDHATERFWRDDTARGGGGSGLGLSIAKSIVEAFGGTIRTANALHGGAEVSLQFPRRPEKFSRAQTRKSAS